MRNLETGMKRSIIASVTFLIGATALIFGAPKHPYRADGYVLDAHDLEFGVDIAYADAPPPPVTDLWGCGCGDGGGGDGGGCGDGCGEGGGGEGGDCP